MMNKTFDGVSSQGRPTSGDLSRTRAMYQSEMGATKNRDDIDMDAVSQATGVKPKTKLGHSASRPKSSYSVTMRDKKLRNMLENQEIENALTEYDNKLFNASLNL